MNGLPDFSGSVSDQLYEHNEAVTLLVLPEAPGGDGTTTYTLSPGVAGLTFDASTRQLSGTPSVVGTYAMTYKASDADTDTAVIQFTIRVNGSPAFGTTALNQDLEKGVNIGGVQLPKATGGDPPLDYQLVPLVPGLYFYEASQQLLGTPYSEGTFSMIYTVTDADGDDDTQRFTITVDAPDTDPDFDDSGAYTGPRYVVGDSIVPLRLPGARNGNGDLTYALSPTCRASASARPTGS